MTSSVTKRRARSISEDSGWETNVPDLEPAPAPTRIVCIDLDDETPPLNSRPQLSTEVRVAPLPLPQSRGRTPTAVTVKPSPRASQLQPRQEPVDMSTSPYEYEVGPSVKQVDVPPSPVISMPLRTAAQLTPVSELEFTTSIEYVFEFLLRTRVVVLLGLPGSGQEKIATYLTKCCGYRSVQSPVDEAELRETLYKHVKESDKPFRESRVVITGLHITERERRRTLRAIDHCDVEKYRRGFLILPLNPHWCMKNLTDQGDFKSREKLKDVVDNVETIDKEERALQDLKKEQVLQMTTEHDVNSLEALLRFQLPAMLGRQ